MYSETLDAELLEIIAVLSATLESCVRAIRALVAALVRYINREALMRRLGACPCCGQFVPRVPPGEVLN